MCPTTPLDINPIVMETLLYRKFNFSYFKQANAEKKDVSTDPKQAFAHIKQVSVDTNRHIQKKCWRIPW